MAKVKETSRSRIMSSIRRRDTKAEVLLRKALFASGIRGYRVDAKLAGRPDVYFSRYRLCVFVDGCFWHACPLHYSGVSTNVSYWLPKINRNVERDRAADAELVRQGHKVLRFWEHDIHKDGGQQAAAVVADFIRRSTLR